MAICENCKKQFQAKRVTAKYCSDVCRVQAHRKKKEQEIEPIFDKAADAIVLKLP